MFDDKMKSAISKAISLGLEKGIDLEKAISQTLDLAESGKLPLDLKSNTVPITKTYSFKDMDIDMEGRTVCGYAATWDLDQVDDIIHRGAFLKSIKERFPLGQIKLMSQHMTLIGKPVEMYEDEKGLYVKAYISKTTQGNDDLQLVKDKVLDKFSIGFSIPGGKYEIDDKGIRHIFEVKLMEFSLVTFPANEAAIITDLKEDFDISLENAKAKEKANKENEDKDTELKLKEDEAKELKRKEYEVNELKNLIKNRFEYATSKIY